MTGNGNNGDGRRQSLTLLEVLGEVDGRTRPALAYRRAVSDFISDLGGEDSVSRGQHEMCQRAAGMSVLAAQLEAKLIAGHEMDVEQYISLTNALARVFSRIGLKRVPRDVTPVLAEYIDNGAGQ